MPDVLIQSGKYAGRHVSDLCKDRKYMNWVMTTWTPGTTIPKAIHDHIQMEKDLVKKRYTSTKDPNFVKEWIALSYEGYKVSANDLGWVQELLGTTNTDVTIGFLRNECVFKVGKEEFALQPMKVNDRGDTFNAFRHDIQEQITQFRRACFHNKKEHRCPETGILLKNDMNTHTDHHFRKKTFLHLVGAFLFANKIEMNDVEIENCGMFYRLKDRDVADKWYEYHKEHAILRLIHASANTNAEYYINNFEAPPFEPKPKVVKAERIPDPIVMTFDMLKKH
jgi:hypothetical protein